MLPPRDLFMARKVLHEYSRFCFVRPLLSARQLLYRAVKSEATFVFIREFLEFFHCRSRFRRKKSSFQSAAPAT